MNLKFCTKKFLNGFNAFVFLVAKVTSWLNWSSSASMQMCHTCFGLYLSTNYKARAVPVAPVLVTWFKVHEVTNIQGSEHAAKTLIVVNCQHIADINHKARTRLWNLQKLGKIALKTSQNPSASSWNCCYRQFFRSAGGFCVLQTLWSL